MALSCEENPAECIQVWDVDYAEQYFVADEDDIWSLDCGYETFNPCDTVYVDNFITDTLYIDNFITDTVYIDNFITDTITEYVDVIITEYIDCDTGLPCESDILEIIDDSKKMERL